MKREEFKLSIQSNSWARIGLLAKRKNAVINNLFRHFNVENLREAHRNIDGSKAVGIDRVTKDQYGKDLDTNLQSLEDRLHIGSYRPQVKRGVEIPKANGKTRLIAVAAYEDKLVEWVMAQILNPLYEPLFIETSYGFRPKKSTYHAVKTIYCSLFKKKRLHVVDIDIKSFFDTVSHRKLIKMLEKRINDRRLLSLVSRLLEAGVMLRGEVLERTQGTPQGGIVSPILSNIYLHHALDVWFLEHFATKGGVIARYADDVVFTFTQGEEADRFYNAVKERLGFYNLTVNEDKSKKIDFAPRSGNIFNFTGFTFYWSTDRGSHYKRLRVKTAKDRLFRAINDVNLWLKKNRSRYPRKQIWIHIASVLRGHFNYFGLACNRPKLVHFYHEVNRLLFRWLNRRSQRKGMTVKKYTRFLLKEPLPVPPDVRKLKHLIDRGIYVH